ncbi:MAG: oxygen-independent coproporphyrinogen III oxidase [Acidiferrobacter sp.]
MTTLVDEAVIARYGQPTPRYTSYPPATAFHGRFGETDLRTALVRHGRAPWSLYVHIPFCESVCYYCACHRTVTRHHERGRDYVQDLARELTLLAPLLGSKPQLAQLHWGGGTPTFLADDEIRTLMAMIAEHFSLQDDADSEYGIEIDPRHASAATLQLLRTLGFNRLSLGVQDFDPVVQRAIHREQPQTLVAEVLTRARDLGFRSISVDLIYGLPHQQRAGFARTIAAVLALAPDRLSLFSYAHLPQRFAAQRRIEAAALPDAATKLAIFKDTVDSLTAAGYLYIGLDHFARATDELADARQRGTLARNFQGYSTRGHLDVLGIGASAVSRIGPIYSQNLVDPHDYHQQLVRGRLPVNRGFKLDADDLCRRAAINELLCDLRIDMVDFGCRHNIVFADYFAAELRQLRPLADDGLVTIDGDVLRVTGTGQLLVRAVCAVFDRYLQATARTRFSRVV